MWMHEDAVAAKLESPLQSQDGRKKAIPQAINSLLGELTSWRDMTSLW